MKELTEYRTRLMQRLLEAAEAFRDECLQVNDPYTSAEKNGWTIHQIAVHTRDVDELVYGLRARRTAAEDNPEFPNFDSESFMKANYHATEPLDQVLNSFMENIRAFVEWLQALPVEAWSRASRHTTLGNNLTLQSWVEKDLAHIEEHLKTAKSLHQGNSERMK